MLVVSSDPDGGTPVEVKAGGEWITSASNKAITFSNSILGSTSTLKVDPSSVAMVSLIADAVVGSGSGEW